jgi:hypothetical protein
MSIKDKDREDYTLEEKIDSIIENGLGCEICIHQYDCTGASVILGPNGPIYSPCFDESLGDWVTSDEDEINEVFNK